MTTRQMNAWNWSATTEIYCSGFTGLLASYETEQYWDGTRVGHERLMKALIEQLEGLSDRTGLAYRLHQPDVIKGRAWAAKTPGFVDIDHMPS